MQYKLNFHGYTWDEYFYVISEKQGVLVTYRGALDCEGSVKIDEVLLIEGAVKLRDIYEGGQMQRLREEVVIMGDKLFFSYAETDGAYSEIAAYLNEVVNPRFNNKKEEVEEDYVLCKGACSLFPDKLLEKE